MAKGAPNGKKRGPRGPNLPVGSLGALWHRHAKIQKGLELGTISDKDIPRAKTEIYNLTAMRGIAELLTTQRAVELLQGQIAEIREGLLGKVVTLALPPRTDDA